MIELDGSYGEGGGQIVRTALALSCLTKKSFSVSSIRKGRRDSGLKPQHMHCIKTLEKLCSAKTSGCELGSEKLSFEPGESKARHLDIDVGTAGSITLVLQSILLPAFFAGKQLKITLKGGTDVTWSQPADYFKEVLLPQLKKFCEKAELKVLKRGYYPKGGGILELSVSPKYKLSDYSSFEEFLSDFRQKAPKISLLEQGKLAGIKGISHSSKNLEKANVAKRQAESAALALKSAGINCPIDISIEYCDSLSAGSGITLWAIFSTDNEKDEINPIRLGADALGERGKRAEIVGEEAAKMLLSQINSGAPVDEHLVDNILPWMALSLGKIKAAKITNHALTNIYVIEKFLGKTFEVNKEEKIISAK